MFLLTIFLSNVHVKILIITDTLFTTKRVKQKKVLHPFPGNLDIRLQAKGGLGTSKRIFQIVIFCSEEILISFDFSLTF